MVAIISCPDTDDSVRAHVEDIGKQVKVFGRGNVVQNKFSGLFFVTRKGNYSTYVEKCMLVYATISCLEIKTLYRDDLLRLYVRTYAKQVRVFGRVKIRQPSARVFHHCGV